MTTGIAYSLDDNFNGIVPIDNVVRELGNASLSWKVYAQSLPSQGYLGGDVYPYLKRHDPPAYFSDLQPPSHLNLNIVNFSQFSADLSANSCLTTRSSYPMQSTTRMIVPAAVTIATSVCAWRRPIPGSRRCCRRC